ncbi:MAG: DUF6506 family protein [Clostridiales Family XIII bacterium]|jgi:hypothetical protein|nr:DUF6506 family protein [Clostridiales Family XIII bacterium]
MKINAAFLFVVPEAEQDRYETAIDTPAINMIFMGVKSYEEAAKAALELADGRGVTAIELCAGFGHRGVAMVSEAVGGKASVGVVRFDHHPSIGFKSGDAFF